MKKLLISSLLFLATLILPVGASIARAQEVDVGSPTATSAQVDALQKTLIDLLTSLIAQLQAQIADILAKQADQQTQLGAVQDQFSTVVQNTAQTVVTTPVATTVTIGTPECSTARTATQEDLADGFSSDYVGTPVVFGSAFSLTTPLSVSGSWSEIKLSYSRYPSTAKLHQRSFILTGESKQTEQVTLRSSEWVNTSFGMNAPRFFLMNYPGDYEVAISVDGRSLGTQTVTVSACQ